MIGALNKENGILKITLLVLTLFTYLGGLLLDVINVDSAQYASISMEMLSQENWLFLYERGEDYLDKPPMIFWLSALSFKLFGINAFTYKLPSFIFSLLGIYATFKLGNFLYDRKVAFLSCIILVCSLGFIYLNLDVKTDVILCGAVVFSIYQLVFYFHNQKIKYLLGAALFTGIALLSKGPLGLMVPVFALLPYLIQQKKIKRLWHPDWILFGVVITLMLVPMCIGLYQQFDLQPEKIVNGKSNVSGLRFYFWEQSFGRITGENKWKNDTSYFYFVHTTLLFLIPWSIIFIFSYLRAVKHFFKQKEVLTFGGLTLTIIALSLSHYKLPHYIFVVFPLLSILTAGSYFELIKNEKIKKYILGFSYLFCLLFFLASLAALYLFPPALINTFLWIILILSPLIFLFKIKSNPLRPIWISALSLMVFGVLLNFHMLPKLLSYQCDQPMTSYIHANNIDPDQLFFYNRNSRRLEFNLRKRIKVLDISNIQTKLKEKAFLWLYMSPDGVEHLSQNKIKVLQKVEFSHIGLNRFHLKFLNPDTRTQALEKRLLVKVGQLE